MNGRGSSRRRSGRRRDGGEGRRDGYGREERAARSAAGGDEKNRPGSSGRLRWIPPQYPAEPLPSPDCPYCGKPIRDISQAIADRTSGAPVHFDCVIARIAGAETLESGDSITYIGGGRFGIVHFSDPGNPQQFRIKKILEWENREDRPEWRGNVSDHYSLT